jgi:hypothetical protein
MANTGALVVASYQASSGSGHIAVLKPSNRTDVSVDAFGPQECQSGDYNFADTNIVTGFNQHPGAFPSNILYYSHAVTYPIGLVTPVFTNYAVSNQMFVSSASTIVGRKYQALWSTDLSTWTPFLSFTNSNKSANFYTNITFQQPLSGRRFFQLLVQ